MASASSDLDSPKSTKSSNSEEEEEADRKSIRAAHPGSPSNAHQSSDESTTSDGVLVELPHNHDHVISFKRIENISSFAFVFGVKIGFFLLGCVVGR